MKEVMNKKKSIYVYLLLIIIFGSFLRIYNINYDDFWSDEMASFWISDPTISFNETLLRAFSSNWMVFYEICLKYFHSLLGYEVNISRYFSFFISVLSLISFGFLLSRITKMQSVMLGLFILSINIYHIKYSIELRSYIFAFFLVTIFIYLNFRNNNSGKKLNISHLLGINLITILMLFCHPFTLLVVGSFIAFELLKFFKNKKINFYNLVLTLSLTITTIFFLIIYFKTTLKIIDPNFLKGISPDWLLQVKPSFYTNFYFSTFFGSRILGLIHLLILLFCIYKFKKSLINEFNVYTFFVILIFLTYFIPLLFGYIFDPILLDRFIFFVLIPIICLLSHFILLIKSKLIKYSFLFLICLTTFLNHLFFENTFKQFYTNIYHTKPQVKKALQSINESNIKFFTFKRDDRWLTNTNDIYENYLIKYLDNLNYDLKYFGYGENNNKPEKIWVLYFKDITELEFEVPNNFIDYEIKEKREFNRLNLFKLNISN